MASLGVGQGGRCGTSLAANSARWAGVPPKSYFVDCDHPRRQRLHLHGVEDVLCDRQHPSPSTSTWVCESRF